MKKGDLAVIVASFGGPGILAREVKAMGEINRNLTTLESGTICLILDSHPYDRMFGGPRGTMCTVIAEGRKYEVQESFLEAAHVEQL